ncbi:hypothetical protein L9F63_027537, partial [Diploptera punctata]
PVGFCCFSIAFFVENLSQPCNLQDLLLGNPAHLRLINITESRNLNIVLHSTHPLHKKIYTLFKGKK